ncbi:MAG: 16S rRNA (cytidine(1402)-2'-O)-methyltransferase [Treponema sp.]|nr:16S rRNA (cytidine(1402)-2'-O)-methyltransferase [Treponema sp.]
MIATPIGNLGDMTFRAVETLKTVDLVACEDTRRTLKLLTHFGIRARLLSCRAVNEASASRKVIAALDERKTVAYCSDAGTPAISDPGAILVRSAAAAGHTVIPLPGASALASLVSIAGGADKSVVFEGFLSPKDGRRKSRLKALLETGAAFVLYESPFRIRKLLADIVELDHERYVCVGREMTKVHEEYLRGSASEIAEVLGERTDIRGEFSVFVSGHDANSAN